jgi:hypothetical protein
MVIIFKHKFKGLKTQWFKSQFSMNCKIGGLTMYTKYDWYTFSPDYVRGMKQKLRTSRNKISMQIPVTMMYGSYMTVMHPTGAHIIF